MKQLLLLALLAFPAAAQQRYAVSTGNASLSGAATAVTVQQPALGGTAAPNTITFESAVVFCSVACVVTQTQNATAASTTTATPLPISPSAATSAASAFTASNFSGGTAIPPVINVPAGGTVTIDLSKVVIPKGGNGANYTVSIAAITGTANITLIWRETS